MVWKNLGMFALLMATCVLIVLSIIAGIVIGFESVLHR
jgi:hypothetical protein